MSFLFPLLLAGEGNNSLLRRLEDKYRSLQTLQAHFTQIFTAGQDQRVESGVLYVSRGGRTRWEYRTPEEKLFLSDGRFTYFYVPSERSVAREPIRSSDDARAAFLFLLERMNFKKFFSRVEIIEPTGSAPERTHVLVAWPKSKEEGFVKLRFEVNEQSLQIQRVEVEHEDGTRNAIVLSSIRENVPLTNALFVFKVPKGVTVLEQ